MSESATQAPTHEVILTDVAAAKVKSLLEQEGRDDLRLRIAVQPGGCSGLPSVPSMASRSSSTA